LRQPLFCSVSAPQGKHVVTANKALIANFLPELTELLAANPTAQFAYEAAVCGGIPVIRSLQSDFLSDSATKVATCAA
jgi:homoserine dehydrogenase